MNQPLKLDKIKKTKTQFKEYPNEEIITKLRTQNEVLDADSKIQIIYVRTNRRGTSAVVEVDEETHERMIRTERVYIDYDVCRVYEHTDIMRCLNCQQFNHTKKYCKNNLKCGRCAEEHETSECNSTEVKCINCCDSRSRLKLEVDVCHTAWNINCPLYLHKTEIEKRRLTFLK